jgi:hypothetical protein
LNAITLSLNSSHASLVSHPDDIAGLILNASEEAPRNLTEITKIGISFGPLHYFLAFVDFPFLPYPINYFQYAYLYSFGDPSSFHLQAS